MSQNAVGKEKQFRSSGILFEKSNDFEQFRILLFEQSWLVSFWLIGNILVRG